MKTFEEAIRLAAGLLCQEFLSEGVSITRIGTHVRLSGWGDWTVTDKEENLRATTARELVTRLNTVNSKLPANWACLMEPAQGCCIKFNLVSL